MWEAPQAELPGTLLGVALVVSACGSSPAPRSRPEPSTPDTVTLSIPTASDTSVGDSAPAHDTGTSDSPLPTGTGIARDTGRTTVSIDTGVVDVPVTTLTFATGRVPLNLLVISIDTLRADSLDRLGGSGQMPFLSSLADEGFSVDDTRACAHYTFPTTSCALGGRSAVDLTEQTGVYAQTGWGPQSIYPEGTPFLPTWLGNAGFTTMLYSANIALSPPRGQARDFQTAFAEHELTADPLFDTALAGIEEAQQRGELDGPWYIHLHLYDPHREYAPPPAYMAEVYALDPIPWDLSTFQGHNEAGQAVLHEELDPHMDALVRTHFELRYEAELAYLDDVLAERWRAIEALGLLDDTLVMFWSDHGEQRFEHRLLGHGLSLYAHENQVMWFFWSRDLVPGFTTRPALTIDMVPTLLDLYGLPRPAEVTGLRLDELPEARTRLALGQANSGPLAMALRPPWLIHWGMADTRYHTADRIAIMAGRYIYDLRTDPDALSPLPTWPSDPAADALWDELAAEVRRVEDDIEATGFPIVWP